MEKDVTEKKYKVLICEDEAVARKMLSRAIEKEGFEVISAEDGEEGLIKFKLENPDIVVTDIKMPKVDGEEVVHTIRHLAPHVQIVVLTGHGDTDMAIAMLREGVLDYIKKPIDLDVLLVALGRAREKILEIKELPFLPHILLAEDEEEARKRLTRVLRKENWHVYAACDGNEAVELFKDTKMDIVLLDMKMPGKDGIQALHEMRELTHDFEAVVITGYGDEAVAIQALRDGAFNFLKKPVDLDHLIITVEKAFKKLTTTRALGFRNRELALTKELMAKIAKGGI